MNRTARALTAQALILGILAGGLGRLTATKAFLAYVRPGMRLPLAASVVMLVIYALARANAADNLSSEEDEHHHVHTPRIGWLLLVPVVCIAIVPLRPLGADAVSARSANVVAANRTTSAKPTDEIPAGGKVKMLDFVTRVINDPKRPYTEPVTVTGFVVDQPAVTDGFVMARFVMSCCAADAQPVLVHVVTDRAAPAADAWVQVKGTQNLAMTRLDPAARAETENIQLDATSIRRVGEPDEPYEAF